MKKGLLTLSLCALSICWGQRNMDFSTSILSPLDNEEVVTNQTANFSIQVTNQGSENFLATDSLYVYVSINGAQIFFQPSGADHKSLTGNAIAIGGTFNFAFPIGFTSGFENTIDDICFNIIPVNAADEIAETTMNDNSDCVTVKVIANDAGLKELETNSGIIYPNPVKDQFFLDETSDNGKIEILSLDGKNVEEISAINGCFNVSHLSNGTYIINYGVQGVVKTVRLIVAH